MLLLCNLSLSNNSTVVIPGMERSAATRPRRERPRVEPDRTGPMDPMHQNRLRQADRGGHEPATGDA